MRYVTDFKKYGETGAQARFCYKGKYIQKFFSGKNCVARAKKWVKAERSRLKIDKIFRRHRSSYSRKNNRMPIGTTIRTRDGNYVEAYVQINPYEQEKIRFSIPHFGIKKAKKAAIQWRKNKMQTLRGK